MTLVLVLLVLTLGMLAAAYRRTSDVRAYQDRIKLAGILGVGATAALAFGPMLSGAW